MSKISRKIQADKGMTEGVSHLKTADWSKWFVWKFIFSLTSYSVFYCQRFPVKFTVYGNFHGNFPAKGLFSWVFTVFSCKITVNRKHYIKICVINFTVSRQKTGIFFSEG